MRDAIIAYEPFIRLGAFGGVLAAMAIWELVGPRRKPAIGRLVRWPNNLGVVVVDTLLVRLVIPATAVGLALVAQAHAWGLFNTIALPAWIAVVCSVILLDLAIYFQHVLFHAVPALWRLHRMHHADLEFDVTTGLRLHPIEILLSMVIKLAVVVALGAPAVAVLIFEVLLNATSMFNHGNIRIPLGLDRVLSSSAMRANSGSIECCSSRSAGRPAHIRWDDGRADDEHAPFAAAPCARAVAHRHGGI